MFHCQTERGKILEATLKAVFGEEKMPGFNYRGGEAAVAELPVAGIFRLGVNRSGTKGRVKKRGRGVATGWRGSGRKLGRAGTRAEGVGRARLGV